MKKRFLSLLLALVLCIGLLPMAANAAVEQPAIQFALYDVYSNKGVKGYDATDEYHYVYLGQWGSSNESIKWRVLDTSSNTGEAGTLFLLADECLIPEPDKGWNGHIPFNPPNKADRHLWQGSDVQAWCKDTFYKDAFTPAERALIRSTSEASSQFLISVPYGPPFAYQTGTLQDDYVFAPSIKEINKAEYGFTNGASLAAGPFSSPGYGRTYWLRSYAIFDGIQTTTIMPNGGIGYDQTNEYRAYVRPAMNLNPSNAYYILASAADGGKNAPGMDSGLTAVPNVSANEWKLTMSDPDRRSFQVTAYDVGNDLYLAYTGATTGDNEYISGYINVSGAVGYYGRLGKVTGSSGAIKVSKNVPNFGSLQVFNEQYNGDYHTDYASNLVWLNPSLYVDAVEVTTSLTNITSNATPYAAKNTDYRATLSATDSDKYMLPKTITVTVGGAELPVGEYSYNFNDGTLIIPGGKIADAVHIEATAVEKTWGIKADPTQLVFDTKHFGYPEIKAVRVTLENTGNQTLKLSVPTLTGQADKYDITFGSDLADGKLSLAPGKTEAFTIRPKTGLLNGRYDGQVKITTDHDGTTASIPFLFTVQEAIVNNSVIHGVTGPVTGETPVTEIVETEQYTGTVTWSPAHSTFAPSTKYTATITLTPKPGYTLAGVPADCFAVDGADCTNAENSGVIAAVFPATATNARPSHRVTVEPGKNSDVTVSRPAAPTGTTITVTVTPDAGYELSDLIVTDKNSDELDVKSMGGNKFSFRMPAGGAFVSADFVPQREYGSFGDVARGDYFFDAAEWAAENGIMDGVGGGLFAPHSACTRAQIVTILYRMEGSPAASANPFRDVVSGSYYENAVAWAAEHSIVAGYGSGLFGPNDRITREQLAAILYRYAQYKALDVSAGEDTNILSYNDATDIADYAYPVLQWACGAGLLKGTDGDLLPQSQATRAQTVTILYRMNELLK